MNRLSLLAGPIPPNPKQNIKEEAFLEYLKSFSLNGLETLEKIESQFNKSNTSVNVGEDFKVLKKIKTLIGSYELFVMEMNDSCEFIEVPEFGTCLLKLFIQLIGIVKWSIQRLILKKQLNIETAKSISQNPSSEMNQTSSSIFSYFNSAKQKRNEKTMRNTLNGKVNHNSTLKQGCCPQCLKRVNSNNIYKAKQQATLQLRDINEEIMRISKQYLEEEKKARKQEQERNQLQKFIQKRDELGRIEVDIGLGDQSKNEQILTEIIYSLSRKGEAIKKFVDLRTTSVIDSSKIQTLYEEDYQNLKEEVSTQQSQKVTLAKQRLAILFKQHIIQKQKLRKQQLIDTGVQIQENESLKMEKIHTQKMTKRLKTQIKRLQKEFEFQKGINQEMRKLLAQKSIEFESQAFKYRNELLNISVKSKNDNIKSKPEESLIPEKIFQKSSFYSERNSQISIDINQQEDPFLSNINEQTEQNSSLLPSDANNIVRKGFLKTGKKLTQTKKTFKFKRITDNQSGLSLISSVLYFKFIPNPKMLPFQTQVIIQQKSFTEIINSKEVTTKSCSVQTDDQSQRKKTLADQFYLKSKNLKCGPVKTDKRSSQTYRKVNITSKIKKHSAHEQNMTNKLYKKKQSQDQDECLLSRLNRKSKSSKFLHRLVKYNTIQQMDVQNEFTPLDMAQLQVNRNGYEKKQILSRGQITRRKKEIHQKQPHNHLFKTRQSAHNYEKSHLKIRFKSFQGFDQQKQINKENITAKPK